MAKTPGCGRDRVAVGAVVAAEVAHVDGVVGQQRAAAAAVLGVRRVGHAAQRDAVVLHAEVRHGARAVGADAPEVGDERVVGVEHELRGRRRGDGRRPAVGDRLQLAVAVELVAEEVGQQQRARRELGHDAVQPELVDLEEPGVAVDPVGAARRAEQHAGQAAGHVRPGAVVHEARAAVLEDRRDHRGRRRLAVRRRDHRAALRQAARELADRAGLQAHEQLARQARAAAPRSLRQRARGARDGDLRREHHAGTRTRTAWGMTRIVNGVLPIGSPSA